MSRLCNAQLPHEANEGFHSYVARDADDHAANLTGWNQLYDQLSRGQFTGRIGELWIGKFQIFSEATSHAVRQSCQPWPNSWWFGIPLRGDGVGRMKCGCLEDDAIAICPGGTEFELVTPNNFEILGLVIDQKELADYPEIARYALLQRNQFSGNMLRVGKERKRKLQFLLQQIMTEVSNAPHILTHEASRQMIRSSVLEALSNAYFKPLARDRHRDTHVRHHALVSRIREYVLSRAEDPVMISDFCREFRVSRRTLQNAFQDVVGMSPATYLRTVRLNGVPHVAQPGRNGVCVQDAAYEWGFWHLSQFACDYRKLFGELPSEFLRQRMTQ